MTTETHYTVGCQLYDLKKKVPHYVPQATGFLKAYRARYCIQAIRQRRHDAVIMKQRSLRQLRYLV